MNPQTHALKHGLHLLCFVLLCACGSKYAPDPEEERIIQEFRVDYQDPVDRAHRAVLPSEADGLDPADEIDPWVELREKGYVNCLYLAIARGVTESAIVWEESPLPDLASYVEISGSNETQDWLERLNFPYDELSPRATIKFMEDLATVVIGPDKRYMAVVTSSWDNNSPVTAVLFRLERVRDPERGSGVRVTKIDTLWPTGYS